MTVTFGKQLQTQRQALKMTQQDLAERLHVTRQTVSRWETEASYPNLDILVELSTVLNLSLDDLLKADQSKVVADISQDVRLKRRYRRWLLGLGGVILLLVIGLGILSWGRYTQNELIDRFNPFLPTVRGYAVVPEKTPTKIETETVTLQNGRHKQERVKTPQPVKAFVTDNAFGEGQWLTFRVGMIPKKGMNYAYVQHKGSYVSRARLLTASDLPKLMRSVIGKTYFPFDQHREPTHGPLNPFSAVTSETMVATD